MCSPPQAALATYAIQIRVVRRLFRCQQDIYRTTPYNIQMILAPGIFSAPLPVCKQDGLAAALTFAAQIYRIKHEGKNP
jgi:hypothetical protein